MKTAQETYDMDSFLDEVLEDKIKLIDKKSSPSTFEQDSILSDNDRKGPHEHLVDSGTEDIEAMAVGKGVISCPIDFIQKHSIAELESAINATLNRYPEFYMEGAEGVWAEMSSQLNDTYEITDKNLEDSSCVVGILSLKPISEYESEITIEVSGSASWSGEMHEPHSPEDY